jgi:hypothetical protein
MGSLEALSACPHLTRLVYGGIHRDDTDVLAPFPASWREGLRSLKRGQPCGAGTMGWVEQLRGLTSLGLEYISMTPAFLRCDLDLASSQPRNRRWHHCVMRSCYGHAPEPAHGRANSQVVSHGIVTWYDRWRLLLLACLCCGSYSKNGCTCSAACFLHCCYAAQYTQETACSGLQKCVSEG